MPKIFFLLSCILLVACQPAKPLEGDSATQNHDQPSSNTNNPIVGLCYTVDKDAPAQIKINEDQSTKAINMQMKESDGTWDTPEPMRSLGQDEAWSLYQDNIFDVAKNDIVFAVAREDGVMALAYLTPELSTLNPQLDSNYIVNLLGTINTIYQVDCDNEPVNLLDYHHNHTQGGV